ncbi:MAG: serine hydrolase [Pseudanabaenaceae cyanobacterium]
MTFFQPEGTAAGERLVQTTCEKFQLSPQNLGITVLLYNTPSALDLGAANPQGFWQQKIRGWSWRGLELTYPASVIKLFYAVAVFEWLHRGMLTPSPELERALHDMLVHSSNDATSYIVDILTGTTSGPELPPGPFETWQHQRQLVNRYFHNLGIPVYAPINICQKTWNEGPYGRERLFYGDNMGNRNLLTTDATAHLLHSIIGGVAVTPQASHHLRSLLRRSLDPVDLAADPENQVTGFLGQALPAGAKLWSKAGWTSQVRHDAAYIERPDANALAIVVFTEGQSANTELLPFLATQILNRWS